MTDPDPTTFRHAAVLCPHCEQVTMPNLLADGSTVCSCPAERALALEADGTDMVPPPEDGPEPPGRAARPVVRGQFGRDVATEAYRRLREPPKI